MVLDQLGEGSSGPRKQVGPKAVITPCWEKKTTKSSMITAKLDPTQELHQQLSCCERERQDRTGLQDGPMMQWFDQRGGCRIHQLTWKVKLNILHFHTEKLSRTELLQKVMQVIHKSVGPGSALHLRVMLGHPKPCVLIF